MPCQRSLTIDGLCLGWRECSTMWGPKASPEDWRSKAQAKGERHTEDPVAIALERARERGRGREAGAAIPPLGWRDILWRVLKGIIEDRICFYTSGGVAFFTLLAFFPLSRP